LGQPVHFVISNNTQRMHLWRYISGTDHGPKNWHVHFSVRLNIFEYWPILKLILLSESGEHF